MPKSKRDKKVSLTKTKKKGLDNKKQLVSEIQECLEKYKQLFVISVQNMRNTKMRDVRQEWAHSRFFFGKNKVMGIALGRTKESEHQTNLHLVTEKLQGQTGLLFTDSTEEDVLRWFENYTIEDYARSGNQASYTVVLEAGSVPSFSHSLEPQLRQLGLPTTLERGVITLLKPYTVCKKDDTLNPEQARILKLFDHKMAKFHITIEAMWTKKTKKFKSFDGGPKKRKELKGGDVKIVNISGADLKSSEITEVEMESDGDDNDDDGGGGDNDDKCDDDDDDGDNDDDDNDDDDGGVVEGIGCSDNNDDDS